jgi:hypothetical protein
MTYPASNCKFEIKLAISKLESRRNGWSKKLFEVVLRVFECAVATCEIGLIYSKGLDPRGENVLCACADAPLETPRPYGYRIVMCNGAAILFKAKKQTLTAPSTTWAELVTFSDCALDVRGCRNLIGELGFPQEEPTPIGQDNQSAQTIVNNRGSLGQTSRAMDLKVLSSRNRIEDHEVVTEDTRTDELIADNGYIYNGHFPTETSVRSPFGCNGHVTAVAVGQRQRLYSGVGMFTGNYLSSLYR